MEDYLTYLDSIEGRAEFDAGVIYDMAGSSNAHSLIGVNISSELRSALRSKGCRVYGADANLAIDATVTVVMPDVHVVCGEEIYSVHSNKLHTNAILVVEVLSPSSESFDRGEKFHRYMNVATLQEYVLVDQFQPHVDVLQRLENGTWLFRCYESSAETIHLRSLNIEIPLSSIYAKVEFEPNPDIAIQP
ncbi:MAG: hypothetical protein RLZZ519_3326 [Bacteroidota bacterium]